MLHMNSDIRSLREFCELSRHAFCFCLVFLEKLPENTIIFRKGTISNYRSISFMKEIVPELFPEYGIFKKVITEFGVSLHAKVAI